MAHSTWVTVWVRSFGAVLSSTASRLRSVAWGEASISASSAVTRAPGKWVISKRGPVGATPR